MRSKVDTARDAADEATSARAEAEEKLEVEKVAGQAMLTRLQTRSSECTALQKQLSARAVELVHAREEKEAMAAELAANTAALTAELAALERWIFGDFGARIDAGVYADRRALVALTRRSR